MRNIETLDVNPTNVEKTGFLCCLSKPESAGYRRKLDWLKARFAEGLKIKMIARGGRGFIEYIPGEFAWRAIHAPGYMVVHCLWVVGRTKGRGCGTALLQECVEETRAKDMCGVAAVTAHDQLGLTDTGFFLKQGFQVVGKGPPRLDVVALKLRPAPDPEFIGGWNAKLERLGPGLSVVYTAQCPYTCDLVQDLARVATSRHLCLNVVRLETVEQVRNESPSAYSTFDITANGRVLTHLYHHMSGERLQRLLNA